MHIANGMYGAIVVDPATPLPKADRSYVLVASEWYMTTDGLTTPAQFDELVNIQLKGPFFLTQALLPLISEEGRIVNISTGVTRFTLPGFSAYAAMKGGIEVLTRYLAKELGPHGIVVNTLAPGAIETDFGGGVVRDDHDTNQFLASNTALGRVGMPDDIGDAIAALLSDDNRWITGQRIEVSGGMFL